MYTVFVTWSDAPKRAERLDANGGTTTTRKFHATAFPNQAEAERVAHACLDGVLGVQSWRVSRF